MASRQSDPLAQLLGLYLGLSLFLILVVFASPVFLVGVAAIVGYKAYQAYQHSPAVLARRAREQSLTRMNDARENALRRQRKSNPSMMVQAKRGPLAPFVVFGDQR